MNGNAADSDGIESRKIPQELVNLKAEIEEELAVAYASSDRKATISRTVSVKDIDLDDNDNGRAHFRRLDLIEAWEKLVDCQQRSTVFFEYAGELERAFGQLDEFDTSQYKRVHVLLRLLQQCVECHEKDDSVKSRFVTILEILRSCEPGWEPSEKTRRTWKLLGADLEHGIEPVAFRREAYQVLMSLNWVPSTSGLLDACSWDESKQEIEFTGAIPQVQRVIKRIRGGKPRPRFDCVNQILDRLKDETGICIAIVSEKDGMGKTTLAAQVASHHAIKRSYTVLWLSIDQDDGEELTYEQYKRFLDLLCEQLSVQHSWPELISRFEDSGLKHMREKALMLECKTIMSETLSDRDKYLLVVDNVTDDSFLPWFQFCGHQTTLLTTIRDNLSGIDWFSRLEPMSEDEAVELFLREAKLPDCHALKSTFEMQNIVRVCECVPLYVRTVARWYFMKQVTAGQTNALLEIHDDLQNLIEPGPEDLEEEPHLRLFDITSLMMGPLEVDTSEPAMTLIVCLCSLSTVLPERVALDVVILLFEQVVQKEEHPTQSTDTWRLQVSKKAWLSIEGLLHLGVISIYDEQKNPWVEIHHSLYRLFGVIMAQRLSWISAFEDTITEWNKCFVTAYFEEKIQHNSENVDDNSWLYALEFLPSHMLAGCMLDTAENVLSESHFLMARLEAVGWEKSLGWHIRDCVSLQREVDEVDPSRAHVFQKTAEVVRELAPSVLDSTEVDVNNEIAHVFADLGFAQSAVGDYEHAIALFQEAQVLQKSDTLLATVLYGEGWALLASNVVDQALLRAKTCHDVMSKMPHQHVLFLDMLQLVALTLVADCQYTEAREFYNLLYAQVENELTTSPVALSNTLHDKARIFFVMGDFSEAQRLLEQCVQVKRGFDDRSTSHASALVALGDCQFFLNNFAKARESYQFALQSMKDDADFSDESLEYLLTNGRFLFVRGDHSGSAANFEAAHVVIQDAPELALDTSAYDLRFIASTFQHKGDVDTAVNYLHDSLALTHNRSFSLERAFALQALGTCLLIKDDTKDGLVFLEKALEIQIMKLGECDIVLDSLKVISGIHSSLEAHDEALNVLRRIQEITRRLYGEDSEHVVSSMISIGDIFVVQNRFEEALEQFEECLDNLGNDDEAGAAKLYQRIGNIYYDQEDFNRALEFHTKALEALKRCDGDPAALATSTHMLGVLARRTGDLEEAQEYFFSALDTRRIIEDNVATASTLLEIGNVYRLLSDFESADSVYEKGLEILLGTDPLYHDLVFAKAHILLFQSDYQNALARFVQVREARISSYGRDHMKTGVTSRSLGLVQFLVNHIDEAMVHLNEFVRVYELQDENANETIDYAMSVLLLGDMHSIKGNRDQAENLWSVALEVCEDNGFAKSSMDFVDIVNSRNNKTLPPGNNGSKDGECGRGGLFSRLAGRSIDETELLTDANERKVLESLVFVDDY